VRIVGEVFDPDNPTLLASWQTLGGRAAGLTVDQYDIGPRPGVHPDQYASALNHSLGRSYGTSVTGLSGFFGVATSLIAILTLMVAVVAGLGVLNTVLLGTRQRIHELGVFKAIGMTPRQMISMVLCWVAVPALAAVLLALPAAILLHAATLRAMAHAAGTGLPASFSHVFPPSRLALLALAGLVIAAAGALLPASGAARSATVGALRAE
jgi:putative ABC transport system permease protein